MNSIRDINLKIGFDLIPRADGNPSIRFRDFEDFNLRKFGSKSDKSRISVRADTSVESAENKEEEPKEEKESDAEVAAASSG
ncbi:unnamed protein product [Leptosia nina]|uniref:Uncharacterized protein n=1 Tax=Leptosia nina TaxID=320188 RepID=A0AAV1J749_9NEOP